MDKLLKLHKDSFEKFDRLLEKGDIPDNEKLVILIDHLLTLQRIEDALPTSDIEFASKYREPLERLCENIEGDRSAVPDILKKLIKSMSKTGVHKFKVKSTKINSGVLKGLKQAKAWITYAEQESKKEPKKKKTQAKKT